MAESAHTRRAPHAPRPPHTCSDARAHAKEPLRGSARFVARAGPRLMRARDPPRAATHARLRKGRAPRRP
eukprot:6287511-Prymnesium_polylepis.1